jgi:predicted Holliday junction resolvase-like endonuclease
MITKLFAPLAMRVAGGIIALLLIALSLVIWRADAISEDREHQRNLVAQEKAFHEVTKQSLAALEDELASMVRDGQLRADRLAKAQKVQEERTEELREEAERIRTEGVEDACVTPEIVRRSRNL